jgi:hypothetical protein
MASVANRSGLRAFALGALLAALLLAAGTGCVHPCLALAEEICECEETEAAREDCKRRARDAYESTRKAELDAARSECSALLDRCDCAFVDTEEGKQACGLAREE